MFRGAHSLDAFGGLEFRGGGPGLCSDFQIEIAVLGIIRDLEHENRTRPKWCTLKTPMSDLSVNIFRFVFLFVLRPELRR